MQTGGFDKLDLKPKFNVSVIYFKLNQFFLTGLTLAMLINL